MGGHGSSTRRTWAPGQLVRLTGCSELAVPLGHETWSLGVKRPAALGLPNVCGVWCVGGSGAHRYVCVCEQHACLVHTVAVPLTARHTGWPLGHMRESDPVLSTRPPGTRTLPVADTKPCSPGPALQEPQEVHVFPYHLSGWEDLGGTV